MTPEMKLSLQKGGTETEHVNLVSYTSYNSDYFRWLRLKASDIYITNIMQFFLIRWGNEFVKSDLNCERKKSTAIGYFISPQSGFANEKIRFENRNLNIHFIRHIWFLILFLIKRNN